MITWTLLWLALVVAIRVYAFPPPSKVRYVGVPEENRNGLLLVSIIEASGIIMTAYLVVKILGWIF